MTTPLPQTPGDQREDHAAVTAAAIGDLYANAELVIIAAIAALARKLATGSIGEAAAARQVRRTVTTVLSGIAPSARALLNGAMNQAAAKAAAAVRTPLTGPHAPVPVLNPARPAGNVQTWTQPVAKLLDTAGDTAAQAAEDEFATVAKAIANAVPNTAGQLAAPVVPPVNPYQAAVSRAFGDSGGWPGSTLSYRRIQAAQAALDDLAQQGITGFTDKAGRNWDLATYVEMATRTATSNAWDDMQAAAAIRSGLDLVETGTYSQEGSCPLCVPWLGKTLSLTGTTTGYPTVDEAKAAGWRHPNCRCFWVPIGAALAMDVTNPVDLEDAAQVYKASQHQRALERDVRAAGRAAHAAVTPQAKTRARRDLAAARAASAAHRQQHQLRMMKVSVQRRERPWGAR